MQASPGGLYPALDWRIVRKASPAESCSCIIMATGFSTVPKGGGRIVVSVPLGRLQPNWSSNGKCGG